MRVIAGIAKGRRLTTPPGLVTRPMTDRAREAIFSSIAPSLPGGRVLDLYAGTGSLGLEALSRGASSVVFVERDRAALVALRANVAAIGLGGQVMAGEVEGFLMAQARADAGRPYDLVFVDPPYREPDASVEETLGSVAELVRDDGTVVLHRRAGGCRPEAPGLDPTHAHTYGSTRIWRYRRMSAHERLD